jgi:hypothetical protein
VKEISINGDKYMLPTMWNELSREQLLDISNISLQPDTPVAVKTKTLFALLGISIPHFGERHIEGEECFYAGHGSKTYLLRSSDILAMTDLLDFMFKITEDDKGNKQYQFHSKLFRQLIHYIYVSSKKWYGPDDGIANMLFAEFIRCETFYTQFLQSQDSFHADCLIATMYRPQVDGYNPEDVRFKGDRREPLNDFVIHKRAKLLSTLPPQTRQAVLFFYEGCKTYLRLKYPNVFEEGGDTVKKDSDTFESYIRLATTLAKNDATQTEAWLGANLHAVMLAMDNARIEQKEMEKLYKK